MEITVKYEGYIARQEAAVRKAARMENEKLPPDMDYLSLTVFPRSETENGIKSVPLSGAGGENSRRVSPADISVVVCEAAQRKKGAE